jgi:peptidyl-prolyl cis-trans isomerase C
MRVETVDLRAAAQGDMPRVARINGVALNHASEDLSLEVLRQRACLELLRQAVMRSGLLDTADAPPVDGVVSEAASQAIDAWLDAELKLPEPSDEACARYYAAHLARYCTGEKVRVRHVLFAVTPGIDVVALRNRAETCLLDLRCHDGQTSGSFGRSARALSNCPSGEHGGELGWLGPNDCAPEFARELFGHTEIGVLPRLVHSRFGLHVVEVLEREGGVQQPFEAVRGAVAMALRQHAWVTALHRCMRSLAGQALVEGVNLDAISTASPPVYSA